MNFIDLKKNADDLVKLKNYKEAIEIYQKIIKDSELKKNKEIEKINFNLGFCFYQIKNFEKALFQFELVINKNNEYLKAYYYKGLCHIHLNENNKAIEIFLFAKKHFKKEEKFFDNEIFKIRNSEIEKEKNFDFFSFLEKFFDKENLENKNIKEFLRKFNFDKEKRFLDFVDFLKKKFLDFKNKKTIFLEIYIKVYKKFENPKDFIVQKNDEFLKFILIKKSEIDILLFIKQFSKNEKNFLFVAQNILEDKKLKFIDFFNIFKIFYFEKNNLNLSNSETLLILNKISEYNYDTDKEKIQKLEIVISKLIMKKKSNIDFFFELTNLEKLKKNKIFSLVLLELIFSLIEINEKNEKKIINYVLNFLSNLENLLEITEESLFLKKKLLNIFILFITSNRIFQELKEKDKNILDNLIKALKKFQKNPELVENLIILKLLVELRFTKKLVFNKETWNFLQILLKVSEREEVFLIISLISQNHIYLKKLLYDGVLQKFLKDKKMDNFKVFFYFIQTLAGIYENTHEEKMKELKKKYQVGDNSVEAFEKINKMMKNSEIEFLKEKELDDIKFINFLITEIELNKKIQFICANYPKAIKRIFPKIIFLLHKILLKNKFLAPKFLTKDFLDLINSYKINLKKLSSENSNDQKNFKKEYLQNIKKDYFGFISRFLSGIEIQNLQEYQKSGLIDALCWSIKNSEENLIIFESLLCLTRFTGKKQDYNLFIWKENKLQFEIYDYFLDENLFIKSAAIELLNNLIINRKVFTEFILDKKTFGFLNHMKDIILILMKENQKFLENDLKFGGKGYLFTVAVSISILICYAHQESKKFFVKEINFEKLESFIDQAFDDKQIVHDLKKKLKLLKK